MDKKCSFITDATTHEESGLLTMPVSERLIWGRTVAHTVPLPPKCCPVSDNPIEGSTITLEYQPGAHTLEVYSLTKLLQLFVGGFAGNGYYPPERNMEGMVELIAQMAADALKCPVTFTSHVLLTKNCGTMKISGVARPR